MPEVVLLGGHLRRLVGESRIEARSGSVASLLDELVGRGGDELAAMLFEPCGPEPESDSGRALSRDLRVLVNGRSVAFLDGLDTAVVDSDRVTLHFSGIRGFPGG